MREEEAGNEANRMKVHAKGLILSHALTRMTAPSCGGSLLAYFHAKPPLKGEVPALGGRRGSVHPRRKVAAALSAAVTTTKQQESAPN